MSQIEAVFFDCDGTLVDSEVICSRAYVTMFRQFGITLKLTEVFRRFKGVKLYEIIDTISKEHGVALAKAELEPVYRAEVARLFDTELEAIAGANTLLESIKTLCAWYPTDRSVRCSIRWVNWACCIIFPICCLAVTIFNAGSPIRR